MLAMYLNVTGQAKMAACWLVPYPDPHRMVMPALSGAFQACL
jgi:hypothetical protein